MANLILTVIPFVLTFTLASWNATQPRKSDRDCANC